MPQLLLVCLGGAAGSGARYLLTGWALRALGASFPFGTLLVNVVGSFLIGAIQYVGFASDAISPATRLTLTAGVLGGFTTYSAFSYETLEQMRSGAWALAGLYVASTLLLGALACWLGFVAGRMMVGA